MPLVLKRGLFMNMKKLFEINKILIIVWEFFFGILFGSTLSLYIDGILAFSSVFLFLALMFFPLKKIFTNKIIEINFKNICFSLIGATGLSFIILYILSYNQSLVPFWQDILFIFALIFFFLPIFISVFFYFDSSTKKECNIFDNIFYVLPMAIFFLFFFFIQPIDLYIHNRLDITFSLIDAFLAEIYFIPFLLLIIFVLSCLPKRIMYIFSNYAAVLNLAMYLQLMFFNKYVGQIIGGKYIWKLHPFYSFFNLFIWILLFSAFSFFIFLDKIKRILIYLNIGMTIMLLVGISYSILSLNSDYASEKTVREGYYLDNSEQFTVGDENVIFLVADAVDNSIVKAIYEDNPNYFAELKDFTMYTDTCSVYDWTADSVPQMLFGYTKIPGTERTIPFMERFDSEGYRFLIYSYYALMTPGSPEKYIANYVVSDEAIVARKDRIRKCFAKITFFQLLPCVFKQYSHVESVNFDFCFDNNPKLMNEIIYDNYDFEKNLLLSKNIYSDKCFVYQHIKGIHEPCDDYMKETIHSIDIFKEYIRQMKELGVYNNSVIIIASDHGFHDGNDDIDYPTAATPMFLIKGKNENKDCITISATPMYYIDILPTVLKKSGLYRNGDLELFGESIDEYDANKKRVRVWFDSGPNEIRKYTFMGDTLELERVVNENIYEKVDNVSFDYSEIE